MRRSVLVSLIFLAGLSAARADSWADCAQDQDLDRTIRGCTEFIEQGSDSKRILAAAYGNGIIQLNLQDAETPPACSRSCAGRSGQIVNSAKGSNTIGSSHVCS